MRKCVVFGGIAASLAFAPAGAVYAAGDYEAPSGIELSIGDTEIDRADLAGGRLVEVPVNIGNNSGFVSVKMLIQLDGRLSFAEDYELGTRAEDMAGVHISEQRDMENTRKVNFVTKTKSRCTSDGEIGYVRVMLSEDTPVGRYDINIYPYTDEPMILTYNNFDAYFGAECFSQLRGGTITVKDGDTVPQQEQAPPRHDDDGDRNAPEEESSSDESESNNETHTTTSVTTATTVTTTKTTAKTTVTSTKNPAGAAKETSAVTASEATPSVSAVTTEPSAETDTTKPKKNLLLIPVIAAAVIALGTACFIVRKGGRSNE
ncbi:hypothetical protein [Ruminococcus flavefaciens]|uniref:Cohesin domain-containing protein n=1 Tax=Ruminococcus flavefaciens TaxID=1265 RepID=A0A1K1PSF8_RUMFL|nr:hypothetical protein [Ruminococcus flavefaciens]SFW49726.1 hypothetical protein SAMN02910280_0030 [Ruminococcus flavefaciens]